MAQKTLKLVKIGNSRGVRLPKAALDALNHADSFTWAVENGALLLQPLDETHPPPRAQWRSLIAAGIVEHGDDADEFLDWEVTPADGLDEL
jgi:antitoxin component of MazEF toxin-antitoxin module